MKFDYHGNGGSWDVLDKSELVVGQTYKGMCRNASEAVWLGDKFEYTRSKFGHSYQETLPHPEDDQGYDVFMPLRSLNERLPG